MSLSAGKHWRISSRWTSKTAHTKKCTGKIPSGKIPEYALQGMRGFKGGLEVAGGNSLIQFVEVGLSRNRRNQAQI